MDEEIIKQEADYNIVKDSFKSKDYYLKELESINDEIDEYKDFFNEGSIQDYNSYYNFLKDLYYDKIQILYLLNISNDIIKKYVEEYCQIIKELTIYDKLSYNDIVKVLSLGYLYNIDTDDLEFIKLNMIEEKYVDAILDLLVNKIFNNRVSTTKDFYYKEKGYFGDEYDKDNNNLMNAINSDSIEIRNQEFVNFLNNVKNMYYERLLKEYKRIGEDRYTYTGSFDFKLTAIAKILGIDKNLLMNSKFIADDLI